jgi:ABC-2 type transport system permease protein
MPRTNPYAFFVPGLLVQLGLFGTAFVGVNIIVDWREGVLERLRVTPVSRLAILIGRTLRDVVVLVLQGGAAARRGGGRHAGPVAGVLIGLCILAVLAFGLAAFSYGVGLLSKSEDILSPVLNMVMVPTS